MHLKQDPHQRAEQPKTSISCSARMSRTIILLTEMIVLNGQHSVSVRDKQPEKLAEHESEQGSARGNFLARNEPLGRTSGRTYASLATI